MFEFYYRNRLHRALAWIEIEKDEFLVLSADRFGYYVYKSTEVLPDMDPSYFRENMPKLNLDMEYSSADTITSDMAETEYLIEENVPFEFLLNKFLDLKAVEKGTAPENPDRFDKYEEKLISMLKANIDSVLSYRRKVTGTADSLKSMSFEVERLIEGYNLQFMLPYLNYLRVKVFEKMSLMELSREKLLFENALENGDLKYIEYKINSQIELQELYTSLLVVLEFKEDIYLCDLLGIYREPLEINPYTCTEEEYRDALEGRNIIQVCPCARDLYSSEFYESIGMDPYFFEREISGVTPDEFENLSRYLFSLIEDILTELSNSEAILFNVNLKKSAVYYDKTGFVSYFIDYIHLNHRF